MKKSEIKVGGHYRAKVSRNLVTVRVDAIRSGTRYLGSGKTSDTTVYDVTNLKTGRRTTFRSAMKFRNEAGMEPTTVPKRLRESAEAAAVSVAQSD